LVQPFFWRQALWLGGAAIVCWATAFGLSLYGLRQALRRRSRPPALAGAALALLALLLILPLAAHDDPRWHEKNAEAEDNRQLWRYLDAQAQRGDVAVVDMLLYYDLVGRTAGWMNATPPTLAYIGWLRTPPGQEPAPLARWLPAYQRVWLSLAMTPPGSPESTTESWLDRWAYRGEEVWFGTQRLVSYLLPSDQRLAQAEAPLRFGDRLTLQDYTVQAGKAAGFRLVDLTWLGAGSPDLRLSLQVLDPQGGLLHQIDRIPGSLPDAGGAHDRMAIAVPAGGYKVILKAYDAASGQPFTVFDAAGGRIGEYWVLDEENP
jgi:hypothetical protein